ncbi:MAG: hypothetical protein IJW29_06455 [Clostridia bacterium]|nr:hypothetical protein [Clostridia bacterium]MBQ9785124.1 hypothetical protein [Clostridia bacterium]
MGAEFGIDVKDFDRLQQAIADYGGNAEDAINRVLHEEAGPLIYEEINPLINPSGRKFKGHAKSAKNSPWPLYDTSANLAVTVKTKAKWGYLYFPDDGSNTRKHAGNQHFFQRGGDKAAPKVVDRCLNVLIDEWKG